MKTCPKCGSKKSLKEFYKRKTGLRAGEHYNLCNSCHRRRGVEYYAKNKTHLLPFARRWKQEWRLKLKALIYLIKKKPCADCKKSFEPWLMEFDHVSGVKLDHVGDLVGKAVSLKRVLKEISKCVLVCVLCHRKRTHERGWKEKFVAIRQYAEKNKKEILSMMPLGCDGSTSR